MKANLIEEKAALFYSGKIEFPELSKALMAAGVERYSVDLIRLEKVFYGKKGELFIMKLPLKKPVKGKQASRIKFAATKVQDIIGDFRDRRIVFDVFLKRALSAGVVSYTLFLTGKHAVFCGRRGETHIEHFS